MKASNCAPPTQCVFRVLRRYSSPWCGQYGSCSSTPLGAAGSLLPTLVLTWGFSAYPAYAPLYGMLPSSFMLSLPPCDNLCKCLLCIYSSGSPKGLGILSSWQWRLIIMKMPMKTRLRVHVTPVRMAVIRETNDSRRWWLRGERTIPIHCCWTEGRQPLCTSVLGLLRI